ncbi:MAG: DNA polymerase III subunit chi [Candidatus Brocadiaceae bacterium]|nr:DNA polymerase III subunit chi [Candidatus Brocadiaceae bacterium]
MATTPEKIAEYVELASPDRRMVEACERTRMHYEGGRTVAVHVPDADEAAELDKTLWTFRREAFIPHVRLEEAEGPVVEPVVLFGGDAPDLGADVLVVLTAGDLPEGFERFAHIIDFAEVYDEARRGAGRRRFAACQAAGYRMRFVKA